MCSILLTLICFLYVFRVRVFGFAHLYMRGQTSVESGYALSREAHAAKIRYSCDIVDDRLCEH